MKKDEEKAYRQLGFTLMEMLVVLVLIGLIAAVAIPQVIKLLGGAKVKTARIQLQTVSNSLLYYQSDVGAYPTNEQGLEALWKAPKDVDGWHGPYVRREKQLIDPWGHKLVYREPATKKDESYDLISLGADGKPGGTGDDADLSSAD